VPQVGRLVLTMLFAACAGTGHATGKLVVSLKVSGVDIGTIYTVTVDEMPPKSIPRDGTREFDLPVADYVVRLHWAADNCVPSPTGVQSVSIRDGETSYLG